MAAISGAAFIQDGIPSAPPTTILIRRIRMENLAPAPVSNRDGTHIIINYLFEMIQSYVFLSAWGAIK